jgi:uncharacterized protein
MHTQYPAVPPHPAAPLLVLAHGAGAGQAHPFMVTVATGLAERGVEVVTFDFDYMARGRKTPDRTPVLEDTFRAAIAQAAGTEAPGDRRLVIGGKSMGGRIATHLAAQVERWPPLLPPLAGVVALGYPLAPPRGRRTGDRVSHLGQIAVPTLIVQGTRDAFGGPDEVSAAIASTGTAPPIAVQAVEGGDHSFAVLKSSGRDTERAIEEVVERVAAWIKALPGKQS